MKIVSSDDGLTMTTVGLSSRHECEISATVSDVILSDECYQFVSFVAAYIADGNKIQPGETLGYGYWTTKAVADVEGRLSFWERTADWTEFVPGVTTTLRYWHDQHLVCERASSLFVPPNPGQLIVISDGVYEGDKTEGVRYATPAHMSGWWITTDRYDGKVSSLKTVHAHHVTEKRPDLAKFLALAVGYRFFANDGEVRFDPKVVEGD